MPSEPRRIEEIVRAALTMPLNERAGFIADVCAGDDDLRRRVETWLRIRGGEPTPPRPAPTPSPAAPLPVPVPAPAPRAGWAVPILVILLLSALAGGGGLWLVSEYQLKSAEAARILALEKARAAEQPAPDASGKIALDFVLQYLLVRGPLEPAEAKIVEIAKDNAALEALLREALGSAYLARGDTRHALTQLQLAAKQRDNPTLQARLAEAKQAEAHRADPETLKSLRARIDAFEKQKQLDKAEPLLREIVGILKDHGKVFDLGVQEVLLARNLLGQEKYADAEPVLRDSLEHLEKHLHEKKLQPGWSLFDTKSLLGAALLGQKKYPEAEPFLVTGYEGLKEREEAMIAEIARDNAALEALLRGRVAEAGKRVLALYEAWGKPEKVAVWKRKLGV
jgi:hypothetical protein